MDKIVIRSFGGIYMNKKNILEYVLNKADVLDVNQQLIEEMELAKMELDTARSMFNNVNDSSLIEVAIYSEDVAKKRYDYLLSIAKEKGISVGNDYIFERNMEIAE
jgi:hypothetical protein